MQLVFEKLHMMCRDQKKRKYLVHSSIFLQYLTFLALIVNLLFDGKQYFINLVSLLLVVSLLSGTYIMKRAFEIFAVVSMDLTFYEFYLEKYNEIHFGTKSIWKRMLETQNYLIRDEKKSAEIFFDDTIFTGGNIPEVLLYFKIKMFYHFLNFDVSELNELSNEVKKVVIREKTSEPVKENVEKSINQYLLILSGNKELRENLFENFKKNNEYSSLFLVCIIDCVNENKAMFEENKNSVIKEESEYYFYKILKNHSYDELRKLLFEGEKMVDVRES